MVRLNSGDRNVARINTLLLAPINNRGAETGRRPVQNKRDPRDKNPFALAYGGGWSPRTRPRIDAIQYGQLTGISNALGRDLGSWGSGLTPVHHTVTHGRKRTKSRRTRHRRRKTKLRARDRRRVRTRQSLVKAGRNRTAKIDRISKRGRRNQMISGRITVNGRTYRFNSGGSGRGSLPRGRYTVRHHRWSRKTRGMVVGGVGYSFAMSNKYDPRVRGTRKLLRIHPDGGRAGTAGCIGIVGNARVQRQFRKDMAAELRRNGGRCTLRVG